MGEKQGHKLRPGTKPFAIVRALESGPKSSAELCEVVDEIGSYLTRTVAKLVQRGIVENMRPGKGHKALYAISRATGEDSPANEGEGAS